MRRIAALIYAIGCYTLFLITFIFTVGFVSAPIFPKTIDSGDLAPWQQAFAINVLLLLVFALQHSVMARKKFKAWWKRYVPAQVERSTYVLFSSLALALLLWQWKPIPQVVWHVTDPTAANVLTALSFAGWLIALSSTFLIDHFELFGVMQVIASLKNEPAPQPVFRTPLFYRIVRHPLYLGFIIAFWATPLMSVGHALFAFGTTAYIVVGIMLEERDLVDMFGEDYRRYRALVPMLFPWFRGQNSNEGYRTAPASPPSIPRSRPQRSEEPGE